VRSLATGRVIAHRDAVSLSGAVFRVSEAGRQRVLREGVKNVHAWVAGDITNDPDAPRGSPVSVRYNPRTGPRFVTRDTGEAVLSAALVRLLPSRAVLAWGAVTESPRQAACPDTCRSRSS